METFPSSHCHPFFHVLCQSSLFVHVQCNWDWKIEPKHDIHALYATLDSNGDKKWLVLEDEHALEVVDKDDGPVFMRKKCPPNLHCIWE